jgi:hypothetical protein
MNYLKRKRQTSLADDMKKHYIKKVMKNEEDKEPIPSESLDMDYVRSENTLK